jgi:hypothetical protein
MREGRSPGVRLGARTACGMTIWLSTAGPVR